MTTDNIIINNIIDLIDFFKNLLQILSINYHKYLFNTDNISLFEKKS